MERLGEFDSKIARDTFRLTGHVECEGMFNRLVHSQKYPKDCPKFSFSCLLVQVQHLEAVRRLKEGGRRLQRTVDFSIFQILLSFFFIDF